MTQAGASWEDPAVGGACVVGGRVGNPPRALLGEGGRRERLAPGLPGIVPGTSSRTPLAHSRLAALDFASGELASSALDAVRPLRVDVGHHVVVHDHPSLNPGRGDRHLAATAVGETQLYHLNFLSLRESHQQVPSNRRR